MVRERHGDDGVGGMAGAEDIVDAAKPMLGVEGFHAWGRDLVALDGREVVDEEIAAALPHHVDIEDGGGHVLVVVKFGFLFNLSDMAYFGVCHTAQVSTRIPTNQLFAALQEVIKQTEGTEKDPIAVLLGRRGGLKGGRARAAKLTPARRRQIAKKAAAARWKRPKSQAE